MDEIFEAQPILPASVLCLHRRGVSDESLARIVSRVRFSEELSAESKTRAMRDPIQDHAEVNLLSLVMLQLQEHGLTKMASEAD